MGSITTEPVVAREPEPTSAPESENKAKIAVVAAGTLGVSLILAWGIRLVQTPFGQQNERAVLATAILFAAILIAALGGYLLRARRLAQPETTGLIALLVFSILLVATYFYCVSSYVFFPADFLIWSEGDFVNDILKITSGFPLYTAPVNMDSTHYVPGPQVLTYLLATLVGKGHSIPVYRMIQVGYTAIAAFFATLCVGRILSLTGQQWREKGRWIADSFCYAVLFLMATNSITNPFAHNLHGDALAQLATMVSYYLLLSYIGNPSRRIVIAMAILVPFDLLVKQNLLIWGVFYAGYIALVGRQWKRAAWFSVGSGLLLGAIVAAGYALWRGPFIFWIFQELSRHAISPLRAIQHTLDSWPYFAAGLLGGVLVFRSRKPDKLLGAWVICLLMISIEAYTSGIEWMMNHIGPGCLMAGIWLMTGIMSVSKPRADASQIIVRTAAPAGEWIRAGALTAVLALMFNGLGMVRIPLQPLSPDAYRYVRDIEKEFAGLPPNKVLLDVGTWIYAKDGVVMGDRAAAAGMLAMAKVDAFSGIRSRLEAKRYSKILVRSFHEPDFWYDNATIWPKSSGLRNVLLENYRETGTIRAADGPKDVKNWAEDPHLFGEITILEPK